MAKPLYDLTDKKGFHWGLEQQEAFSKLVGLPLNPPVLAILASTGHIILDTDASDFAVGGELSQAHRGQERTIGYGSDVLSTEKCRYCTTRKE
jgi:hypothetical protein